MRLLAGINSAAPLSNAGGSLNDIGNPVTNTFVVPLFATCGFAGPTLAPLIGGYLADTERLGWRWCFYLCAIWHGALCIALTIFMPETLASALLAYKAARLRATTGDTSWRAKIQDEALKTATIRALKRPFVLMTCEPILICFIAYMTSRSHRFLNQDRFRLILANGILDPN